VTGFAEGSGELYILGENKDEKKPVIIDAFWPLPLPTNETDIPGMYYYEFDPPQFTTRDLALEETGSKQIVWIATGEEEYPIKVYQIAMMGTQKLIGSIPAKTGIGNDIWGLAFEKNGSDRFLWASNRKDNKIYKIDLDDPTENEHSSTNKTGLNTVKICSTPEGIKLFVPCDGNKTVTVTDLQGRTIASFAVKDSNWWYTKKLEISARILIVKIVLGDGTTISKKEFIGR